MAHPALIDDFLDDIMGGLREGKTLHEILAGTGLQTHHFYHRLKQNPELQRRYAEVRQEAVQARADKADAKADEWIEDENCAPALRIAWLKRHQPAFRDKVEIDLNATGGSLETATLEELRAMLAEAKSQPAPGLEAPVEEAEVVDA